MRKLLSLLIMLTLLTNISYAKSTGNKMSEINLIPLNINNLSTFTGHYEITYFISRTNMMVIASK